MVTVFTFSRRLLVGPSLTNVPQNHHNLRKEIDISEKQATTPLSTTNQRHKVE